MSKRWDFVMYLVDFTQWISRAQRNKGPWDHHKLQICMGFVEGKKREGKPFVIHIKTNTQQIFFMASRDLFFWGGWRGSDMNEHPDKDSGPQWNMADPRHMPSPMPVCAFGGLFTDPISSLYLNSHFPVHFKEVGDFVNTWTLSVLSSPTKLLCL